MEYGGTAAEKRELQKSLVLSPPPLLMSRRDSLDLHGALWIQAYIYLHKKCYKTIIEYSLFGNYLNDTCIIEMRFCVVHNYTLQRTNKNLLSTSATNNTNCGNIVAVS